MLSVFIGHLLGGRERSYNTWENTVTAELIAIATLLAKRYEARDIPGEFAQINADAAEKLEQAVKHYIITGRID